MAGKSFGNPWPVGRISPGEKCVSHWCFLVDDKYVILWYFDGT
jgi:hypothetical protein